MSRDVSSASTDQPSAGASEDGVATSEPAGDVARTVGISEGPPQDSAEVPASPELLEAVGPPLLVFAGDTDLLLAAGAAGKKNGIDMLYQRFSTNGRRLVVPKQVRWELTHHQRGAGALAQAAGRYSGTRGGFVKNDETRWSKEERASIRALIEDAERRAAAQRRGRLTRPKLTGHDGEIEAILLAQRDGGVLLSNDRAARAAAQAVAVPSATFAMVLAAEVADGNLLADEASAICLALPQATWSGLDNPTPQRIVALTRQLFDGL